MDYKLKVFTLSLMLQKGIGTKTFMIMLNKYKIIDELFTGRNFNVNFPKFGSQYKKAKDEMLALNQEIEKRKIDFICVWEDTYPSLLKETYDPPIIVFYKGDIIDFKTKTLVSIVGTRKPTDYGLKWAYKLAYELAIRGFVIVSGMAAGIDAAAHKGALDAKGQTIAVLASEVEKPTPSTNYQIYNRIINNGGMIISECSSVKKVQVVKGLFPNRNRIVAGLSTATIVIEAPEKSGALITARSAFQNNRDVFAIPGNTENLTSQGSNELIRGNIAKLINNLDDVLCDFGFTCLTNSDQNIKTLTEEERMLYDILLNGRKFIEELSLVTKFNTVEVARICTMLELKGIVIKNNDGRYCLV